MLKVHTLTLGAYQTNTYIIHNEHARECVIIDPGYEPQVILSRLDALGLTPTAILLTHGHFDHVGAVEPIVETTGCRLWMSESDWSQPNDPLHNYLYPIANCDFCEVQFCEEGQVIREAGLEIRVMTTPGHTYGSLCYFCESALFSGDTLFAGACGRTDLPGGQWKLIRESLARLSGLEEDYTVYPGHGESTTLAAEKQYNPYMR